MQTSTMKLPATARVLGLILMAVLATWSVSTPAWAQRTPPDHIIEIVIKRNLLSFNDANLTGNYDVWHATLSRPFRQQFTADRLKTAFKAFHDQQIDIAPIVVQRPVLSEPARIDREGALLLKGTFETRPSRVAFEMRLLPAEGDWKLIAINVNVMPVDDLSRGSASGKM